MSIEFTGERVVPGRVDPDLWNEHLARYVFAKRFCPGARVLDAGTGAGYGCAALAEDARLAIGFDIAADAVTFASAEYPHSNTRWLQASLVSLPFADGSFDVVVAFEVIEHLVEWQAFLSEARRVLVDGGVLLVSTPNKTFYAESREQSGPNPYHEHEFEYDEFRDALLQVFPNVSIVLENHAECVLFEAPGMNAGQSHIERPSSPAEANFYLALCSTQPVTPSSFVYVPRAANVLKERAEHIRRLAEELGTKNDWLAKAQSEHADLVALHARQTEELKASNTWAKELDGKLNAAGSRIVALQNEVEEQQDLAMRMTQDCRRQLEEALRDLEARTQWARDLEAQAMESSEQLAQCVALLDQAEATVVERTKWAQDLQRQLEAVQAVMAGVNASRWVKLGRLVGMGPELPS
jgi:SAM-dependent methyltransferase